MTSEIMSIVLYPKLFHHQLGGCNAKLSPRDVQETHYEIEVLYRTFLGGRGGEEPVLDITISEQSESEGSKKGLLVLCLQQQF